jgi:ABC-2 type transport system ATP-binding protein
MRDEAAVRRFIEGFAAALADGGVPRMPARVFAALLATDSGRLTAAELGERLQVSPAAISGAVRYLTQVALVAGLASDAELLILDEPTSGLDPLMEAVFQEVIRELKAEGRTVLLSSHILAEVEALCDRVSIIRLGRTVESGSLSDLRHLTRTTISAEIGAPATALAQQPGVHDLATSDGRVSFDVDSRHLPAAVRALSELGLRSLTSHPPTLEQLFLRHYGDELAAEGVPVEERTP